MRDTSRRAGRRSALAQKSFIEIRQLWIAALLCCSVLALTAFPVPTGKPNTYPAWWFSRGVITPTNPTNAAPAWPQNYPASDDYAVINEGQFKNFATAAYTELQASAPAYVWSTPQGQALTSVVTAWAPGSGDNYQSINLGQLKRVSKMFHDVLQEIGYETTYPWTGSGADDYAVANIGQVKNAFSFNVGLDTDNNGLPDWWELKYFHGLGNSANSRPDGNGLTLAQDYAQGNDPTNYYSQNGAVTTPTLAKVSGDTQTVAPNVYAANPLIVLVSKADGTPSIGAPITFAVQNPGAGEVSTTSGGSASSIQNVVTDSNGRATIYFLAGAQPLSTVVITATAGSGSQAVFVTFTLTISVPNLKWTGSVNTTWDTTTANWVNGSTAAIYANGDGLTLDDTGSGGTIALSGAYSPGSLTVNTSSKSYSLTTPGSLTGTMTLTKSGSTAFGLSSANTYTGGTLLLNGQLNLSGSSTALGTGPLTLGSAGDTNTVVVRATAINLANAITVNSGGTRWIEPGNGSAVTYTGPITLNGGVTVGFSTIGGNIKSTGGINGTGNILLGENGGSRANSETLSGGAVNNTGTISDAGNPDTGGAFISANIGASVTGIVQNSASEAMNLSGTETFNGPITITTGTLQITGAGVLGGGNYTGAISDYGILIDSSTANQTWSGVISGTGSFTQAGTGTLALTGTNTYTGATIVSAGTLLVNGALNSPVSVASGATLGGAGAIHGNVSEASGSGLTFNVTSSGTSGLGITGNLTLNGTINVRPTIVSGSLATGTFTLATYTGTLTGTPTLTWTAPPGSSDTATFDTTSTPGVIKISINPPPPVISSASSATATRGVAFSYAINASNSPTSYSAVGLPAGLSIDPTTGIISGTPTTTGTFSVILTASNGGGPGEATLVLTVNPPPPVITSASSARGTTGAAFSYTISASNSPTSYSAAGLPAGLSIDPSTGVISGTPTTVGTSSVTLTAANAGGAGTAILTLTISPPAPVIASAPTAAGVTQAPFSYAITATNSPTSFAATGLPAGLAINTTTGVISGTPTAVGTSTIGLSATNAGGTGTATLTLTITLPSLLWTGSVNTTWDTATANWLNGSTAATYANGDGLTFDDTGSGGSIALSSAYSPGSITVNTSSKSYTLTTPGSLTGTMTLTKSGTTAFGLSSANTYTGGTLVLNGQLSVSGNSSALGTGSLTLGLAGDTNTVVVRANSVNLANPIVVNAGGTRWIEPGNGNAVTYTGPITLNGGVTVGFSTIGGPITVSGGITGTGNILLGENGGTRPKSETLSGRGINNVGTISDAGNPDTGGAFISANIGTNVTGIIQNSTSESLTLTGTNAFNGPITITAGTLQLTGAGVLGGGTYTGAITDNGIFIDSSTTNQTISGVISGTGTLTQSGTGTLNLTGANTYTGATTVSTGTLLVNGSLASPVSVASGATLGGSGAIHGNVSEASGSGLTFNVTSGGTSGLAITGNLTLNGTIDVRPLILSGGLAPGTYNLLTYTGTLGGTPTLVWSPPAGSTVAATFDTVNTPGVIRMIVGNPPAAQPTFSLADGTYTNSQMVTLNCSTPGATIHYTVDGSVPSESSPSVVTGGSISVAQSETLSAIASAVGYSNSSVQSATYVIESYNPLAPQINSGNTAAASVNANFNYTIVASNNPTSFAASVLPDGLSVDPVSGVISGIPSSAGLYSVNLSASNGAGTGTSVLVINVTSNSVPPVINSPLQLITSAGAPIAYQITATNNPSNFAAINLPAGLTVDPTTGAITGAVATAGTYSINLSAANGGGAGNAQLNLAVNSIGTGGTGSQPGITSSLSATATVGVPFIYAITATNSPTGFAAFGLPSGLSFNPNTGIISGTPTLEETSSILISATNAFGTQSNLLIVTVGAVSVAPVITSPSTASGYQDRNFSYAITALNDPETFTCSNLPDGLLFDETTGIISGTPAETGTFTVTLGAGNAFGSTSESLTLTLDPPIPIFDNSEPLTGVVGQPTYDIISASNEPATFTQSGLPSGLSMDSNGNITGIPAAAGVFPLVVTATNSYGTSTETVNLTVSSAGPDIDAALDASGNLGVPFSYTIPQSDGSASLSITGSRSLDSLGLAFDGQTITGIPTTTGVYSFTVTASSSTGTSSGVLNIYIAARPVLSLSYHPILATVGGNYSSYTNIYTYSPSLGSASNIDTSLSFSVESGSLPDGLMLDSASGDISGTPSSGTPAGQASSAMIQVTDTMGNTASETVNSLIYSGPGLSNQGQAIVDQNINLGQSVYYYIQTISGNVMPTITGNLPPGLYLTSYSLEGTPTASGRFSLSISASDSSGSSTAVLNITVASITSPSTASAQVGLPFSFAVTDDDAPTSFQATNLPAGLSIDSSSGMITGTPLAADFRLIPVTVTDAAGVQTGTLALSIAAGSGDSRALFQQGLNPNAAYTTPTGQIMDDVQEDAVNQSGTANQQNQTFSTGNILSVGRITATKLGRGLLAFDLSALPPQVTITSASLVVHGPSAGSSGQPMPVEIHEAETTFNPATATWANSNAYQGSTLASGTIDPAAAAGPITFAGTTAFTQAVQQAFNQRSPLDLMVVSPAAEAGVSQYSPLPDYVDLAINNADPTQNPQLLITYSYASPVVPTVTSSTTGKGTVNNSFSYAITASGNPVSYSASSLPSWLTLNTSTGLITGTPGQVGSSSFTVYATNPTGTGSQGLTVNIDGAIPATGLQLVSGNNQTGIPGGFIAEPLVVQASVDGSAHGNTLVTFSIPPGRGSLALTNGSNAVTSNTLSVASDSSGRAAVYVLLPQSLGTTVIVATAGNAPPLQLVETASINAIPSSSETVLSVVGGEGQSGPPGETLPQPFIVQAVDATGTPVAALPLALNVSSGEISGTASGSFGNSLNISTNDLGQATVYLQPAGSNGAIAQATCNAASGASNTVYLTAVTSTATSSSPTPGGGTPPGTDATNKNQNTDSDPAQQQLVITPAPYTAANAAAVGGVLFDDPVDAEPYEPLYDYTKITISWQPVSNATSYELDRLDDTGIWKKITTTSDTTASDSNLYSEINYQYRVIGTGIGAPMLVGTSNYNVPIVAAILIQGNRVLQDPPSYPLGPTEWFAFSTQPVVVEDGYVVSGYFRDTGQFRLIFNPSKVAGTYTLYDAIGTTSGGDSSYLLKVQADSAATNVTESPVFTVLEPEYGLDYGQAEAFIGDEVNITPNSLKVNIQKGDVGSFFMYLDNSFGAAGLFVTPGSRLDESSMAFETNITYTGTSSLRVEDDNGKIIPSSTQFNANFLIGTLTNEGGYQPFTNTAFNLASQNLSIVPDPATVRNGDSITITQTTSSSGYKISAKTITYTYVDQSNNNKDLSIPIDEASGSRYRKIALNGLPMPDEKPQQSAESDQEKEETYIDALTLGLRHSTTDVYLPVSGSDFSVSARRDFRSQIWTQRTGLRPHEQPDLPFGVCWSSNLAPNIKLTHNDDPNNTTPDQAIVTDETGAVHTFFRWYDGNGNAHFLPMPTAKNEAQVPNLETLSVNTSSSPVTYTFARKYGTTLTYAMTTLSQTIDNDRAQGSDCYTTLQYARLIQAVDRVGNTLNYQFQGTTNLVPKTITVANQPGIVLSIQQQPLSSQISGSTSSQSVVTAVWDSNGNKTSFTYASAPGDPLAAQLTAVTAPDGSVTQYTYSSQSETDLMPHAASDPGNTYSYADIASIVDPLNHSYQFQYGLDHSKLNYMSNPQVYTGYYVQCGSPRNVTQVTMPDGTTSSFVNKNNLSPICLYSKSDGTMAVSSPRISQITDAAKFVRTYTFADSVVVPLPSPDRSTESKVVAFQNLTIGYGNLGSESFQFDIDAAMALSKITDFCGNVTTFAHADPWSAPPDYLSIVGSAMNGHYDDPTSQIDALGHPKTFTYFGSNRIMQSSTDENGNNTLYSIDSRGRRTSETISDPSPSGNVVQRTEFSYGSTSYPGFITRKTVDVLGGSDPGWVKALVTQYVSDNNGRVAQEIVDPGGLNLVTSYTYDANGNKLTSVDPKGNTTWFSYDTRNRLTTVTYADGTQKQIVYDGRGNKIKEFDERGVATLYQYDALNRLAAQARDMNGNGVIDSGEDLVTNYTYNAVNSKLTTTDPNGGTAAMAYDDLQRVTQITDPLNHVTQFSYGANSGGNAFDSSSFKPTHIVDPRGFTTDIAYDALYRPITKAVQYGSGASPSTTSTEYDAVGNPMLVTDPLGHQTSTTYDALNRPLITKYPDQTVTQQFYTSTGFKWKSVDENGNATQTQYDAAGRPTEVISAMVDNGSGTQASSITQTIYDAAGNVAETINPLTYKWDYVYDARNRKVQELEPAVLDSTTSTTSRPTLNWKYDQAGRVTAAIDARGNETDTVYDDANRVTDVNAPAVPLNGGGSSRPNTHTTYDKNGNVLTLQDPNGHTTTNTYDALNRLLTSTDAAHIVVTNTYDEVGNKLTVKDGNSHTTSFAYDGLNRNTSVTDAAGKVTTLKYDAMNKTQRVDALGQVTTYLYDVRNRLSHVVYASSAAANSQRNYAYDSAGNLLSVTEPAKTAASVAYGYDALNRVVSETSQGLTHSYVYDLAGNRLRTTYGGTGRLITSTYDPLNRLVTMSEGGRATSYGYDLNGNIVQKVLPNGDKESSAFDALNRATSQTGTAGGGAALYAFTYGYDLTGNVLSEGETYPGGLGNRTVANSYDAINRLLVEAVTAATNVTTTYTYDNANNRLSQAVTGGSGAGTTSYTYNGLNQLTGWTLGGASTGYTYDADGNRATRTQGGATDTYGYDFENRLIRLTKATSGAPGTYAYQYDYRTRRIGRDESQAGGVATSLVFSGGTSVQEYTGAPGGAPAVEYVRGSDYGGGVGGILYTLRSGTPSYTHENRRGDVVAKTNAAGSLTYQAQYAAFGQQVATSGSTQDRQKSNSKDTDPTSLVDEGFRYRDLETGMFISRDPAGFVDGPNLYTYVVQNPWTKFDPEGLAADDDDGPHHISPKATWDSNHLSNDVKGNLDKATIGKDAVDHGASAHNQYNKRADKITKDYIDKWEKGGGANPSGLSGKDAKAFSDGLVKEIENTSDPYVKTFNEMVKNGATQDELKVWGRQYKADVIGGRVNDVWFAKDGKFLAKGGRLLSGTAKVLGAAREGLPMAMFGVQAVMSVNEAMQDYDDGEPTSEILRTQSYRFSSLTGQTPEEMHTSEKNASESFFNWLSTGSYQTDADQQKQQNAGSK